MEFRLLQNPRMWLSTDLAFLNILYSRQDRYPLSSSARPIINIPNKKRITSKLIEIRADLIDICPVNNTVAAPPDMICQICNLKLPTCRKAIKIKTIKRTIMEIINLINICLLFKNFQV